MPYFLCKIPSGYSIMFKVGCSPGIFKTLPHLRLKISTFPTQFQPTSLNVILNLRTEINFQPIYDHCADFHFPNSKTKNNTTESVHHLKLTRAKLRDPISDKKGKNLTPSSITQHSIYTGVAPSLTRVKQDPY